MAMTLEEIKSDLKKILKPERFEHVLRVNETALRLNNDLKLNIDENKIQYSCILHDCAKHVEQKYFNELKDKYLLEYDDIFSIPALAHTCLGYYVAQDRYGIKDEEILNAIRWHTTGRENMTDLEKLVFVADFIEPGRDFKKLDKCIKKIYDNYNEGLLYVFNLQINHLIKKNAIIDLDTIKARNDIQRRINE